MKIFNPIFSTKVVQQIDFWIETMSRSYATLFYANVRWLGFVLFFASCLQPQAGFCGLLSVFLSNAFALAHGYDCATIRTGWYGYNAMLFGIGLGAHYESTVHLIAMLAVGAWLCFAMTVWLSNGLAKYGLTPLSLPFLLSLWAVQLANHSLDILSANTQSLFQLNFLYKIGGNTAIQVYQWVSSIGFPVWFDTYLRTLSAIFFQDNIVCGAIVGGAILGYSRIAFALSWVGFGTAFLAFQIFGADVASITDLNGSFCAIIIAMAMGCFYTLPSFWSFLLSAAAVFISVLLTFSLQNPFGESILLPYSFPFCLTVWLMLYVLRQRPENQRPQLSWQMGISPEQMVYKNQISSLRYQQISDVQISLPFWGEWMVSQGHDGDLTHLGAWGKAWDFIILDEQMKSFSMAEKVLNNHIFHCYGKPVTAPADGWVVEIVDLIADNLVGDVNIQRNWGNSIVLQHGNGASAFFSQLSHLQAYSIRVAKGDYVRRGDVLAMCGSSGRSPEPHLHFQLQKEAWVGAPTLDCPLAYFIERRGNTQQFRQHARPREGAFVENVQPSVLLKTAFSFIPSRKLFFDFEDEKGKIWKESWEILTNAFNKTYIRCRRTQAIAYFENDGTLFYTTTFEGRRDGLLYYFYLATYKILLANYQGMTIEDRLPIDLFSRKYWGGGLADFVAPFGQISRATYHSKIIDIDNHKQATKIQMSSSVKVFIFQRIVQRIDFEICIEQNRIVALHIKKNKKIFGATAVIDTHLVATNQQTARLMDSFL